MSRTYRHRHKVPKGYKAVDRDEVIVTINTDGKEVWVTDFTGLHIRWSWYQMKGHWDYGRGHQSTMLERWKKDWFGKQKVPIFTECVKTYDGNSRYHRWRQLAFFEKKAYRRRVGMKVHAGDFDQLHLQEGLRPVPAHAYRKPRRKIRSEEEDYLGCVRSWKAVPSQKDRG